MCVYACVHVCLHVHVRVCVYTCMCGCVCVCTHTIFSKCTMGKNLHCTLLVYYTTGAAYVYIHPSLTTKCYSYIYSLFSIC